MSGLIHTKRDNWFLNYQNTIDGQKGQRDLNHRIPFFDKNDFKDKSVIDVGCNIGQMCDYAALCGAKSVIGIEYDKVVTSNAIKRNTNNKITYICDDIDNYFLYTNLEKVDTVLLLSVIETQELTNRFGMLSKFALLCNVMYFEGHINSIYENLIKYIINYTNFTTIEFKGFQYDNDNFQIENKKRSIFRCSRDFLTHDTFINKVYNLLCSSNKEHIAVVGRGGTGKTTLRKKLLYYLNDNGYNFNLTNIEQENQIMFIDKTNNTIIVDDVIGTEIEPYYKMNYNIIYFDYRATEYMKNRLTTVFNIQSNSLTNSNRPYSSSLSHSPNDNLYQVNNIYTVKPYNYLN